MTFPQLVTHIKTCFMSKYLIEVLSHLKWIHLHFK